ncbi:phage tail tape measure protein [Macrococcus hajekii]|uniref:lysostaphin n=1 Tax=Macrococcus hajekii TaxID=198482 RepID=A0A4R6BNX0_9STAP|nr:peptidoglycan DD-metalloendopeptidase family protein [Macrococcus hajekii]TDM03531.1 phage tail tape measure protein [Macrococcus hajekii]GGA99590.1 phage tail tape measure protein [Macrococcus hajekii]
MTERIRGLSIGLDLDSTGIDRSLGAIKRSFKDLNGSLKTNLNNFKYTEKSVDSYGQAIEDLSGTIKNQQKNVSGLKAKMDELTAAGKSHTAEASKIRQEYNKQADNLNLLERQLSNTKNEMKAFQREQELASSKWTILGGSLDKIGGKLTSVGDKFKQVGGQLTMGLTTSIGALGVGALQATADYEAAASQFTQVFGDMEKDASASLDKISKETGLLPNSLRGTFTQIAAFAKTTGSDTEQALDISSRATLAAADSAAFYDKNISEVTESLQSYLKGNYENDSALGISSTETTRNAKANELYSKSFNDLSESQKQLTLLAMVEDGNKLSGALGQASRESDTLNTQLSNVKTSAKDFLAEIGKPVLPLAVEALKSMTSVVKSAATWFKGLGDGAQVAILAFGGFLAALGPVITVAGVLAGSLGSILSLLSPLGPAIAEAGGMAGFFASKFGLIRSIFMAFTGPVGLTIGVITLLGAAFVTAYKKSETFRNIVNGAINGVIGAFNRIKGVFTGVLAMFKGDWLGGATILQKLGFTPEQIIGVENFVISIMYKFHLLKESLMIIFNAIKTFAMSIISQIKTFWAQNGTMIMQAVQNIGNAIKIAFNAIWTVIKFVLDKIWAIMKFVWPAVKMLIVSTWDNIKNTIKAALDIIFGVMKIFGGLFTGNWKKMWEGIKQVLKGALTFVWNFIQLTLLGKIMGVAKVFMGLFRGLFKGGLNVVSSIFKNVLSFIFNLIKNIFGGIGRFLSGSINGLKNLFSSGWSFIKNTTVNSITALFNGAKNIFNRLWNTTRSIMTQLRDFIGNIWGSIKNKAINMASGLWSGVRNTFNNMKNGLKGIVDKIKDHVTGMTNAVKNGVNGLIKGINKVGSVIGLPGIPTFHTGTTHTHENIVKNGKIAQGTMAIVGDKGRGNGKGGFRNEIIEYPNGKRVLTPDRDTMTYLPKGSRVFNGAQTQQILPHFDSGTMWGGFKDKLANGYNSVKDIAGSITKKIGDVMEYATDPGKLFEKIIGALGFDGFKNMKGSFIGDFARGLFSKMKSAVVKMLKGGLDTSGGVGKGGVLDPSLINYHFGRTAAYTAATGRPYHEGVDFPFVYKKIGTPMSGTVKRQSFMNGGYGNWVKVVAGAVELIFAHLKNFSATPADGTKIKAGETIGLTGNTGFSTGPHLHFGRRVNGVDVDPEPWLKSLKSKGGFTKSADKNRFATGGFIKNPGWYNIAEGGYPEWVIPTDPSRRSEAMAMIAMAANQIQGNATVGNKRPAQMNISNASDDTLLNAVLEQNDYLREIVRLVTGIEAKPPIDGRGLAKGLDREIKSMNRLRERYE